MYVVWIFICYSSDLTTSPTFKKCTSIKQNLFNEFVHSEFFMVIFIMFFIMIIFMIIFKCFDFFIILIVINFVLLLLFLLLFIYYFKIFTRLSSNKLRDQFSPTKLINFTILIISYESSAVCCRDSISHATHIFMYVSIPTFTKTLEVDTLNRKKIMYWWICGYQHVHAKRVITRNDHLDAGMRTSPRRNCRRPSVGGSDDELLVVTSTCSKR